MLVGEVAFENLKVGDRLISCTGKSGYIAALYPVGTKGPNGMDWDDWDGGILMLWYGTPPTYSYSGWSESMVQYLGA